jgi:hypothetical protein
MNRGRGSVSIHQKPETLHFGLDRPDGKHTDFFKKLRGLIVGMYVSKKTEESWVFPRSI